MYLSGLLVGQFVCQLGHRITSGLGGGVAKQEFPVALRCRASCLGDPSGLDATSKLRASEVDLPGALAVRMKLYVVDGRGPEQSRGAGQVAGAAGPRFTAATRLLG